jgi:chemotaxis response regulator CheB
MKKLKNINLAIASGDITVQNYLSKMFMRHGADIVLCDFLDLDFVQRLESTIQLDVILIDMDDRYEENDEALDALLEKIEQPILFHDNDFGDMLAINEEDDFLLQTIDKLASKLAQLVVDDRVTNVLSVTQSNEDVTLNLKINDNVSLNAQSVRKSDIVIKEVEDVNELSEFSEATLKLSTADLAIGESALNIEADLLHVWVLGASIGGPEAVKRFLARLPKALPVAFVLAQHLGDGFVALLANQLDRVSQFNVKEGFCGDTIKHGEVIVVPVEHRMIIDSQGKIQLIEGDWNGHYKPSIDCVIENITESFKQQSGVIIFSGMGADGVLASEHFAKQYKGHIWAQSSDTCVISSMPDSVRNANIATYSGSPEDLAVKISMRYMGNESYHI